MSCAIETDNICFSYEQQAHILKNLSFQLKAGRFLSIAGPNGAGKTTLLNLLAGLLKPTEGTVKINSAPIKYYSIRQFAKKVALVRQEFIPVFDFSAEQIVSMARTPYIGTLAFERKADREAIAEAFEMTDTAHFAGRPLGTLSGGERQRIFIARALAQQTPILLLDEPTSFLDMKHQVGIFDLLKQLQLEKQKTIVAVTHDINLVSQYSDMTLLLTTDGRYEFGSTREILTTEKINKTFDVKTFSVQIEQGRFFFPLGKYAANHHG